MILVPVIVQGMVLVTQPKSVATSGVPIQVLVQKDTECVVHVSF